jgi:hypothetical protein
MTTQNLTTARFVLQSLLEELEEFDRCIPVAQKIQVGDVVEALLAILNDRELRRLTTPNARSSSRLRRPARSVHRAAARPESGVSASRGSPP